MSGILLCQAGRLCFSARLNRQCVNMRQDLLASKLTLFA